MGLTDTELAELEKTMMRNPSIGAIIKGTGGVRKMRFALHNDKGKSGGVRVLYVDYVSYEKTILLNAYVKGEKDSITDSEKSQLKKIVDEISKELRK